MNNVTRRASWYEAPNQPVPAATNEMSFGAKIRRNLGHICVATGMALGAAATVDAVMELGTIEAQQTSGVEGVVDNPLAILMGGDIFLAGVALLAANKGE